MLMAGSDERLEFVGRQLSYMAQQPGFELQSALQQLDAVGDANIRETVASIRENKALLGLGTNAGLFAVLKLVKPGADIGGIIIEYMTIKKRLNQDVAVYIASLRGSLIYCGILLAIAMALCLIFRFQVAVSIQTLYENLDHGLPAFTTFMINKGSLFGLAVLIVAALLIAITGLAVFKTHQDVLHFRYARAQKVWFLAGDHILTVANTYTLLAYMWLLLKAGFDDTEVEAAAARLAGAPAPSGKSILPEKLSSQLGFSKRNRTFINEVGYQLEQAPVELIQVLSNLRSLFNVGFQLLIYLLVGSLVIAYYLPVFSLGSLI